MTTEVVRIQLRRGTAAQWTSNNPTLGESEFGVETDTGKFKIGNGETAWSSLSYFMPGNFANYLTTTSAASTYLSQSTAASTYLSQSNAASTYLTQTNAGTTYAAKAGATFTGDVILNADPTTNLGAATKQYVDNSVAGLTWKESVQLLATSNIALSGNHGTLVIDSHPALVAEDSYRLLLTGQSTASENGIYDYIDDGDGTYTLTRSADSNTVAELQKSTVLVLEGTAYSGTSWVQSNYSLADFADQDWVQFNKSTVYSAGAGLLLGGTNSTQFSIDTTVATLTGTQELTNKTLTSPIINAATLAAPSVSDATISNSSFQGVMENLQLITPSATASNISLSNGNVIDVATTSLSGNFSFNLYWNATATNLSSKLSNGQAISLVIIVNQGTTARSLSSISDGTTPITINWQNNSVPIANANKKDIYSLVIYKKSNTLLALGSMSTFG